MTSTMTKETGVSEKAIMRKPLFLLIDIDNTLYEFDETGFEIEIRDAIYNYAMTHLGVTLEEAAELSQHYLHSYGISLYGYVKEHNIDAEDYSQFVHRCSYHTLRENKPLVDMLTRLQYNNTKEIVNKPQVEHSKQEPMINHKDNSDHTSLITTENTKQNRQQSDENDYKCNNNDDDNYVQTHTYKKNDMLSDMKPTDGLHHLYFFTNANRAHARHVLTPLGLKPLFSRTRQPGSPVNEVHKRLDAHEFDNDNEWYGFSYEDQWHLTEPEIANKPMRRAFEAIFRAIDDEIALDEEMAMTWATNKTETNVMERNDNGASAYNANGQTSLETIMQQCSEENKPLMQNEQPSVLSTCFNPSWETVQHRRRHLKPENMVMVDDSLRNVIEPLKLGWNAVWYAHNNAQLPEDDEFLQHAYRNNKLKIIRHILELEDAVQELAQVT